jgi:hypothetical protein
LVGFKNGTVLLIMESVANHDMPCNVWSDIIEPLPDSAK